MSDCDCTNKTLLISLGFLIVMIGSIIYGAVDGQRQATARYDSCMGVLHYFESSRYFSDKSPKTSISPRADLDADDCERLLK